MILEESLISRIPDLELWISGWTNFRRTEYRSPSRRVGCPVLFSVSSVAMKTCDNLRATLWFIQAYSLPQKHVLSRRCLAKDCSAVLLWLRTSCVQSSFHNITKSRKQSCYFGDIHLPKIAFKYVSSLFVVVGFIVLRTSGLPSHRPQ
jgi:hypothetical protein